MKQVRPLKISMLASCISAALIAFSIPAYSLPVSSLPDDIRAKIPNAANTEYNAVAGSPNYVYVWANEPVRVYGDDVTLNGPGGEAFKHTVMINNNTQTGASIGVIFGDNFTATSDGTDYDTIRTHGNASTPDNPMFVIIGDNAKIYAKGSSGDAINTGYTSYSFTNGTGGLGSANVYVGKNAHIETWGRSGHGISVSAFRDGTLAANNVTVGDGATIISHGDSSNAIRTAQSGSSIKIGNDAQLSTYGSSAYSAYATSSSLIELGKNALLSTEGTSAHALYATSSAKILVDDGMTITTIGSKASGIYSFNKGEVTGGSNNTITTSNTDAYGIYSYYDGNVALGQTNIITSGNAAYGIYAYSGKAAVGGASSIITNGDGAHGVYARLYNARYTSPEVTLGDGSSIQVNSANATHGIYSTTAGLVTLEGGLNVATAGRQTDGSYALYAAGGTIDGSTGGQYNIDGDINAEGTGSLIDLNLTDGSVWNGAAYQSSLGESRVALTNASWNMDGDSSVSALTLNTGSQINFAHSDADPTFKTLTVTGNYHGDGGLLVMNTQLGDDSSPTDKLVVTGDTTGSTYVAVNNAGGIGALTTNGIKIIEVQGDSSGQFVQQGRIVAGLYDYYLQRGDSSYTPPTAYDPAQSALNDWYLISKLPPVEPPEEPEPPVVEPPEEPEPPVVEPPEEPEPPVVEPPEEPEPPVVEPPEEPEPPVVEPPEEPEPPVVEPPEEPEPPVVEPPEEPEPPVVEPPEEPEPPVVEPPEEPEPPVVEPPEEPEPPVVEPPEEPEPPVVEPPEEPEPPVVDPKEPEPPVVPNKPKDLVVRPEAGSYIANHAAGNTLFTTRLHDRLGETQYTDVLTGEEKVTSMWLRQIGGRNNFKDSSGQLKTSTNRYVMQLGGDIAQWSTDGLDRWHLGLMAGYANAKSHTHSNKSRHDSRSSIDGYSVGAYGTWYNNDADKTGLYVDTWLLYNWFKNSVNGDDLPSESYDSNGFTGSVESGYTFKVRESERRKVFIQPKAQLTWMGVKADRHIERNGTRVDSTGNNNLQTRLGVRAYMQGNATQDDNKDRTFEPFAEVNWIHNTQRFGVEMNNVKLSQDGARNIGEVKVGIEGQFSQRTSGWINIAQQIGDAGYNDTSGMLGIKYSF
ncbi:autotransporter outer membrane beta-barrel domain-containing protein [Hafnia alvei]|uniref:autotransporter outer membrane beta-barrel domain-containing protein n=1 Tax=Hafnia alvei TaxID=569 RepID=UPI001642B1EA|nr:autotransporter outer membrane beta-barrel domain-containing protein [Hafnia alvei]